MSKWYLNFENNLLENIKDCKGNDLRFFRIEEYLRNAERIDTMAEHCAECASIRSKIDAESNNIKKAINEPGKERKALDTIQGELVDHLKKEHGFYPPMYHTYMQSIYWLVGFMVLAFICVQLFKSIPSIIFYSPAFIIGVTIGQIKGSRMDKKIIKNNKQI